MHLQEIAQQIVDATMEVINNRVINIMDRDGLIIASGDKKRINTYHKGAANVVTSGQIIEIYPDEIDKYPGAKEGVNMPIWVSGKILGVVGVYGHPDEVRIIANLVKKTVELNVEQHLIADQVKLVSDLKQQILRKLIYENTKEKEDEILCLAKLVEIDLMAPHCGIILELNGNCVENSFHWLKIASQVERYLTDHHYLNNDDLFGVVNPYHVFFKKIPYPDFLDETDFLKQLRQKIFDHCRLDVRIAMGSYHPGLSGYGKSFQEAKTLLTLNQEAVQNIATPDKQVDYLLSKIDDYSLSHFIHPIYQRIVSKKKAEQIWIFTTLNALLDHNLNLTETADALYIHKNTMAYRIKRLEKITGLSIHNNFYHTVLLKLLVAYMKRLHKVTSGNHPEST